MESRTGHWPDAEGGSITVRHTAGGEVLQLSGDVDAGVVNELKAGSALDLSGIVAVDVGP